MKLKNIPVNCSFIHEKTIFLVAQHYKNGKTRSMIIGTVTKNYEPHFFGQYTTSQHKLSSDTEVHKIDRLMLCY